MHSECPVCKNKTMFAVDTSKDIAHESSKGVATDYMVFDGICLECGEKVELQYNFTGVNEK